MREVRTTHGFMKKRVSFGVAGGAFYWTDSIVWSIEPNHYLNAACAIDAFVCVVRSQP